MLLPNYEDIKKFEGGGNYAIRKYYKFPWKFIYRKKLQMSLDMIPEYYLYSTILDFGCGPAKILEAELNKYGIHVDSVDRIEDVSNLKYGLIICNSVLEFVELKKIVKHLSDRQACGCSIIVCSPMKNFLTNLYFKLIGDKTERNSEIDIRREIEKYYFIEEYKTWFGLYFCLLGTKK